MDEKRKAPRVLWSGEEENGKRSRLYEGGAVALAWDNMASARKVMAGIGIAYAQLDERYEAATDAAELARLERDEARDERDEERQEASDFRRGCEELVAERDALRERVATLEGMVETSRITLTNYLDQSPSDNRSLPELVDDAVKAAEEILDDARADWHEEFEPMRARANAAEARVKELTDAAALYFSATPSTGCGNGRDDHDCQECRDSEARKATWQQQRKHAERLLRGTSQPPPAPAHGHENCPDNPCPGHHPYCEGVGKNVEPTQCLATYLKDGPCGWCAACLRARQPAQHPPEEDDGEVPEVLVMPEPTRLRGAVPLADGTAAWDVQRREPETPASEQGALLAAVNGGES